MESVLQDVEIAIDNWLEEISSKEIQIQKLMLLEEKINKTFLQCKMEGDGHIDIDRLRFVSNLWCEILEMIANLPETRKEIPLKTLQLFQAGEISLVLANEIITKLM